MRGRSVAVFNSSTPVLERSQGTGAHRVNDRDKSSRVTPSNGSVSKESREG